MKKLILSVITIIFSITAFAQSDTSKIVLPTKDGTIYYENIADQSGQNKDALYTSALKWMADTFVDSKEVIQMKDKDAGTIVGAGTFNIRTSGFTGQVFNISFRIDLTLKDGKSRIRIYQFEDKVAGLDYANRPFVYHSSDKNYIRYANGKGMFPKTDRKFYSSLNDYVINLINNFNKYLTAASKDSFK